MQDFISNSSNFAGSVGDLWKGFYAIIKPLVEAAESLEKLLKLVK